MPEDRKPGRPPAGTLPLSASRMPVLLSPEAQQVINELMRNEGITDRSAIMDKIVKDYGVKVKGIRPALIRDGKIIQTSDGDQAISDYVKSDSGGVSDPEASLNELLNTKLKALRMREVQKAIRGLQDEDGGGGIEGIMKLAYIDRIQQQNQGPEENPMKEMMNMLMPIYGLKMLDKQIGGGEDTRLSQEIRDIKESLKGQNNGHQNTAVIEMQKRIEKMEEEKRYQDLLKTIVDKAGSQKEALETIKTMQQMRSESEEKNEKARMQYQDQIEKARTALQDTQEKIRQEQLKDFRDELIRMKQEGSTGINKMIKDTAEKQLTETIVKGFQAATGEKSTGQIATDLITSVVDRIREPILEPLGQALAYKTAGVVPAAVSQSYEQMPMAAADTGDTVSLAPGPMNDPMQASPDYVNSFLPGTPAQKLRG